MNKLCSVCAPAVAELLNEILDHQIANRRSGTATFYTCYTYPHGKFPAWVSKAEEMLKSIGGFQPKLTRPDNKFYRIYRITKFFRGGKVHYYALMNTDFKMRRGCWKCQLEHWGANTDGGHEEGWSLQASRVKTVPPDINPYRVLTFNSAWLERNRKAKVTA